MADTPWPRVLLFAFPPPQLIHSLRENQTGEAVAHSGSPEDLISCVVPELAALFCVALWSIRPDTLSQAHGSFHHSPNLWSVRACVCLCWRGGAGVQEHIFALGLLTHLLSFSPTVSFFPSYHHDHHHTQTSGPFLWSEICDNMFKQYFFKFKQKMIDQKYQIQN